MSSIKYIRIQRRSEKLLCAQNGMQTETDVSVILIKQKMSWKGQAMACFMSLRTGSYPSVDETYQKQRKVGCIIFFFLSFI